MNTVLYNCLFLAILAAVLLSTGCASAPPLPKEAYVDQEGCTVQGKGWGKMGGWRPYYLGSVTFQNPTSCTLKLDLSGNEGVRLNDFRPGMEGFFYRSCIRRRPEGPITYLDPIVQLGPKSSIEIEVELFTRDAVLNAMATSINNSCEGYESLRVELDDEDIWYYDEGDLHYLVTITDIEPID